MASKTMAKAAGRHVYFVPGRKKKSKADLNDKYKSLNSVFYILKYGALVLAGITLYTLSEAKAMLDHSYYANRKSPVFDLFQGTTVIVSILTTLSIAFGLAVKFGFETSLFKELLMSITNMCNLLIMACATAAAGGMYYTSYFGDEIMSYHQQRRCSCVSDYCSYNAVAFISGAGMVLFYFVMVMEEIMGKHANVDDY